MKYQALKRLKTKMKLLKLCDTVEEADEVIKKAGGTFKDFSYIGAFPTYVNKENNLYYQIQGQHEHFKMVLSLSKEDNDKVASLYDYNPF